MPLILIGAFLALGVYGSTLGWGTDRDSIRVIAAANAILHGSYQRSRSFGFPLHEALSAVLYWAGGLLAVNLGTLAAASAGILVAARAVKAWSPGRSAVVSLALCGSPLLLVNATSAIDFGWDFAAGMALLALITAANHKRPVFLPIYFILCTALLLLRPDNLLFVAALTLPLAVPTLNWRNLRPAILFAAGAAGLAAIAVYLALNGTEMFATAVSTTRPWSARFLRASALGTAAIGPGGALAAVLLLRCGQPEFAKFLWLRRAAGLAWLFYLPRFLALPDQADYLILPVELTILLAAATLPRRQAWVCAGLVCLPAFVTVSVLHRDVAGALHISVVPQWGALPQDWAARRFAAYLETPILAHYVAANLPGPAAPRALTYDTYMPGYRSPAGDLVIGQGDTYRVLTHAASFGTRFGTRFGTLATVPRAWYAAIWACDAPLGPSIGWRGWEAPAGDEVVAMQAAGMPLRCGLVDKHAASGPPRTP